MFSDPSAIFPGFKTKDNQPAKEDAQLPPAHLTRNLKLTLHPHLRISQGPCESNHFRPRPLGADHMLT